MGNAIIDQIDSQMMRFSRVVCIFFMISVHLYPYGNNLSILHGGMLWPVGMIWIDFLGRASVATLSFVSGYLIWVALKNKEVIIILRDKFLTLILPMVAWNIVFIAAAFAFMLLGANPDVLPDFNDPIAVVNAITGALGPTANLSLFFIRDLFVSSILIVIGWPVLKRTPVVSLVIVLALTLLKMTDPVIFRPMILLFMLAGCFFHEKGLKLHRAAHARFALPVIVLCLVSFVFLGVVGDFVLNDTVLQARGIFLRVALIATILIIARECVIREVDGVVSTFEPGAYLAYLSHILLAKFLWEIFDVMGTEPEEFLYIAYFLITPLLIFMISAHVITPLRKLPGVLPRIFTGKRRIYYINIQSAIANN